MSESTSFSASEYETIPSKSQIVPSDHQLAYADGQTIRFEIPKFMGFIDPRQTYLKFKVQVKDAPAIVRFSNKAGAHGLIENLRITDMNTNLVLENIQGYSELAEKLHYYTENRSIRNKRGLTELLEYDSRDFDGESYDNLPSRNGDKSQLFDSYETGPNASYTSAGKGVGASNTCEVAMRLYSGVLGQLNSKMYPAMLNQGLRCEIDLCRAGKCLEIWSGAGVCEDDGSISNGISDGLVESCRFGILYADNQLGQGASPLEWLQLYTEVNPGFDQVNFTAGPLLNPPSIDAVNAGMNPVRNQLVGALNLLVGKKIHAFNNANPPVLVDLGTISSVECNAGEDTGAEVFVKVNVTNPNNVNAQDFHGGAGRDVTGAVQDHRNNTCFIKRSDMFNSTPKLEITDVELVVKNATPPASYIEKFAKQTQTNEGAVYDYYSFSTYRNTVQRAEQVAQIDLPVANDRATSILSLPIINGQPESVDYCNVKTTPDNASSYSYLVNGKLTPSRAISLSSLSNPVPTASQTALWETEKSLASSRQLVRNLNRPQDNFMIGRALARYGGVFNADGNLSLKIEYKNNPSPNFNKLFMNYVGGFRRLRVGAMGSTVEV
tara:strand:- start:3442 stop:5262 length:1821 start_codon:yes stop_codon:yes gene_type:complete